MSKIKNKIIKILEKLIKRKILLIPQNHIFTQAVKSKDGFWYCGNVYDTSDIAYGISINGLVEQKETFLVQKILKQFPLNYIFLDIGANTGYYGIMSAYTSPTSKTYSFEPIKEHCDSLKESIHLNRLSNIELNECALGEIDENKDIYTAGSGTTLIKEFTVNTENKINISVRKLDYIVKEKNITDINFIKIDVEGFELEVLKGSKESIKKYTPILFIEICHTKDGRDGLFKNKNFYQTIEFIENLGYKTQILKDKGLEDFNKDNIPSKGVWMFLFTHKENHKYIVV